MNDQHNRTTPFGITPLWAAAAAPVLLLGIVSAGVAVAPAVADDQRGPAIRHTVSHPTVGRHAGPRHIDDEGEYSRSDHARLTTVRQPVSRQGVTQHSIGRKGRHRFAGMPRRERDRRLAFTHRTDRALGRDAAVPDGMLLTVLNSRIRDYLADRRDNVSVALYDRGTGLQYLYRGDASYDTASIVKAQVLGALLRHAQNHDRPLTPVERALATRMIRYSDNAATSSLWRSLGGSAAVGRFDRSVGLNSTRPGPGGMWGLTRTTARDQNALLRAYAYGTPALNRNSRGYALRLMGSVTPGQKWGVSGGVPGGVTVQLKNGWLPRASHGWRVHSIGHVVGHGRDYTVAVLSQDNRSMPYGIRTVEGVSRIIWRTMARIGHHAPRHDHDASLVPRPPLGPDPE